MRITSITAVGIILLAFAACNQKAGESKSALDVKENYKPGLGEFMITIQLHHAKLWYAGLNNNWKLADYEIGEIKELFENIKQVETDRPEIKTIGIIEPALDRLNSAIEHKDPAAFKEGYNLLTASCNNCHTINHFEFNVITTPTAPPVTDQDFSPKP